MATTIRITRRTPFTKSDAIREDASLLAEADALGAWLAGRDVQLVTMNQLLTFALDAHADAALAREPVIYEYIWDPGVQKWMIICIDKGTISFLPTGDTDPIHIRVEISATY